MSPQEYKTKPDDEIFCRAAGLVFLHVDVIKKGLRFIGQITR